MKTPIDFADIRVGDVVQREHGGITSRLRVGDRNQMAVWSDKDWSLSAVVGTPGDTARWYLIERPTPPIQLPETPTLGWLNSTSSGNCFALWQRRHLTGGWGVEPVADGFRSLDAEVTAFTPAVAVPAEALDELRADFNSSFHSTFGSRGVVIPGHVVERFLAAVDAANGDAS